MKRRRKQAEKGNGLSVCILLLVLAFSLSTRICWLRTGSMAPAYPAGSVIVISPLLGPREGAVCAYRHNGMTVIHRVVGTDGTGYIFKGDANNTADPYTVTEDEIEGRMLFGLPSFN